MRVAETLDLAFLDCTQQLTLGNGAECSDLVQEQRAAVGALESAEAALRGPRVGTALGAKQLGLDQVLGQRSTVQGHEGLTATWAKSMDGACEDVLADTAFAEEEDGGVRGRHPHNHVAD